MGWPANGTKALGRSPPRRSPRPAATRIATTFMGGAPRGEAPDKVKGSGGARSIATAGCRGQRLGREARVAFERLGSPQQAAREPLRLQHVLPDCVARV